MSLAFSTTVIQNRLKALTNALDGGGAAGKILLYDGTRPGTAGAAVTTQNLLATQLFALPSAGTISGTTLTLLTGAPVLASANGLSTWARFTDSTGAFVADMDVGEAGSGKEIELTADAHPYNQLYQGGVVNVNVASLVES